MESSDAVTASEKQADDCSSGALKTDFSVPPVSSDATDTLNADDDEVHWHIDEVYLKDLESDLSPVDLEERKGKAAELRNTGNEKFRAHMHSEAAGLYTGALRLCPLASAAERAILYCNRAACFTKLEKNQLALEDCNRAVALDPSYEKALMRRAQLHCQKEESYDKALEDYQSILKLNPRNHIALEACQRLPKQIAERNERLKNEMIGKLKDLGNVILRPFGLSTDSFQLEPSEGGGYSIKMQK